MFQLCFEISKFNDYDEGGSFGPTIICICDEVKVKLCFFSQFKKWMFERWSSCFAYKWDLAWKQSLGSILSRSYFMHRANWRKDMSNVNMKKLSFHILCLFKPQKYYLKLINLSNKVGLIRNHVILAMQIVVLKDHYYWDNILLYICNMFNQIWRISRQSAVPWNSCSKFGIVLKYLFR